MSRSASIFATASLAMSMASSIRLVARVRSRTCAPMGCPSSSSTTLDSRVSKSTAPRSRRAPRSCAISSSSHGARQPRATSARASSSGCDPRAGVGRVVVEPGPRADDRGTGLGRVTSPCASSEQRHAHGQPVLVGPERAEVVAQALGQHGQHAVDQVDRAGALTCLHVHGRVPWEIVRDVGDVHRHLVAAIVQARRPPRRRQSRAHRWGRW